MTTDLILSQDCDSDKFLQLKYVVRTVVDLRNTISGMVYVNGWFNFTFKDQFGDL